MGDEKEQAGNRKRIAFLIVLVVVMVLAVAGYALKERGATGPGKIISKGDQAPDFRLPSTTGQVVGLSGLRGKVVMVHFWATWCPPCVEELPALAKLYQQLRGADFEMLAVSVDEGGASAVREFLDQHDLNLPVLLDPDRSTASLYGTYKFPETYILDKQGIVRYKVIGPADWGDPDALRAIRALMASG